MLYRYLGQSGLLVSRICLGTMTFGMKDWGCDQKTANAIVRHFIDQGGQFIDTAEYVQCRAFRRNVGKRPQESSS